jgi:hypothetical protein
MSGNSSSQKSNSVSTSTPLTANQVNRYYRKLNKNSGGRLKDWARSGTEETEYQGVSNASQYFSTDLGYQPRSADVTYQAVSDDRIKALGGLVATRNLQNQKARQQAIDEITGDAGLTLAQRQRSTQLTDRDYADRQDAIAKEIEGQITQAALEQAQADQAGRMAQAGFDADQWMREYEGRQNQAGQSQALAAFLQSEAGRDYEARARNAGLKREDLLALAEIYFGGKGDITTSSSNSRGSSAGGGI